MDFCAGTFSTGNTALGLDRVAVMVEQDSLCFYLAAERMIDFVGKLKVRGVEPGQPNFDYSVLLKVTSTSEVVPEEADEQQSPLGWHNEPAYPGLGRRGGTALFDDCVVNNTEVKTSTIPASGRGCFVNGDHPADGHPIMYYFGEFILKKCRRRRRLAAKGEVRLIF